MPIRGFDMGLFSLGVLLCPSGRSSFGLTQANLFGAFRRFRLGLGVAAQFAADLLQAAGLAAEFAHIVQLSAADATVTQHFDLVDARTAEQESTLDANAVAGRA